MQDHSGLRAMRSGTRNSPTTRSVLPGRWNTIKSAPRNLRDHVIHDVGRRIVSGEIKAGEVLPREPVLAQQMAVSRTILREALKVLVSKGLVA